MVHVLHGNLALGLSAAMSEQEEMAERSPDNDGAPAEIETGAPSQATSVAVEPLQDLHTPHRRRRLILVIGVLLATMDLCCLPITYARKTFLAAAWNVYD